MHRIVKIAFKTVFVALVIFGKTKAMAATIDWTGAVNSDSNLPGNWTPATVPVFGDIAEFPTSSNIVVNYNTGFNPDQVIQTAATEGYLFNVDILPGWTMGAGVLGTSGFMNSGGEDLLVSINDGSELIFTGTASALISGSTSPITYNVAEGSLNFEGSSSGGSGTLTTGPFLNVLLSTGSISFLGNSTGGSAQVDLEAGGASFTIDHNVSIASLTSNESGSIVNLGGELTLNQSTSETIASLIQDNVTPGSIIDSGTGVLTLSGAANTYTGGTTINNGATVAVSSSGNLGTGSLTINDGGTLSVTASTTVTNPVILGAGGQATVQNNGNAITLSGPISGAGSLITTGAGSLTLSNTTNTYTGFTQIQQGTLRIPSDGSLGNGGTLIFNGTGILTLQAIGNITSTRGVTLDSNGTVDTLGNTVTLNGSIAGPGSLTKNGSGTLNLGGANSYTGGTIVNAGILQGPVGPTPSIQGNITNNANVTINQGTLPGTYTGVISGPGSVTIAGSNTSVTFTGNNSYTGGTTINPTMNLIGNVSTIPGNVLDNGTLTLDQPGVGTFNGIISGTGKLVVNPTQAGRLILTGANTYTGGTTVMGGLLQGSTTSLQGNFNISNPTAVLDFDQSTPGTYAGVISGPGNVSINEFGGTGTITFTGTNTYTGNTNLFGGFLSVGSDANLGAPTSNVAFDGGGLQFTTSLTTPRNMIMNGTGTIDTLGNTDTLSGTLSGIGGFTKIGSGTLILTGNNTYAGLTTVSAGTLQGNSASLPGNILDNAAVVFNQTTDGTYSHVISGTGTVTKIGAATLTLTGANTYSGGTTITAGTLQGTTTSLQGNILNNAALIFNQNTNGTFNGTLSGTGTNTKLGTGTVTFATNSPSFSGTTFVNAGGLALNAQLGGNVVVQNTGTLSGLGTVLGNLSILSGGTISPDNGGIGTFNVGGNYTQAAGSTYDVFFNRNGNSSLISIGGTATLQGGEVVATSVDGGFSIFNDYEILHADGGVNGTFSGAIANNVTLQPVLIYDGFNVFLSFKGPFVNTALTHNQKQVAEQLINITNPSPALAALLTEITSLGIPEIQSALTLLSGEQYTNLYVLAEESSERFIRTLYDPLRPVMNLDPRCRECCPDTSIQLWVEGGGGHTTFQGDPFVAGLHTTSHEITGGAQVTGLYENLTLGFAGFYEKDDTRFDLGGTDKSHTLLGGIYGLYQFCDYYVLGDLILGSSSHKINRPIVVGDISFVAESNPTMIQTMGDLEVGRDFWLGSRDTLLQAIAFQPYVGVGVGVYYNQEIIEKGASPVNLTIPGQTEDSAFSRVGMHFTALNFFGIFDVGLDAAWQCRLSSRRYDVKERFVEFGDDMSIQGFLKDISRFDGAVTITTHVCNWDLYLQASGITGSQVSSVSYIGGLNFKW